MRPRDSEAFGRDLTVVVLDANPQTRNRYIAMATHRALARHPRVARAVLAEYDDVVETCRALRADILLVMGGSDGFAGVLVRAAGVARASVLWTGEDPYELPANLALSRFFDVTFTNDSGSVSAYGGRAAHLPYAASRDLHVVAEPGDALYDLLFVGTAWPNRVALLDALIGQLPRGLRLKIGLSGSNALPGWHLAHTDLVTDLRVAPRDFVRLAARSRLVLTLDRDFSTGAGGRSRAASPPPRLFEIGLVGTPQFVLGSHPPDPRYYEPGREIAFASSPAEAAQRIVALLADEGERRRLGAAARRRTEAEHLYEHRVATILAALDAGTGRSGTLGSGWRRFLLGGRFAATRPSPPRGTHIRPGAFEAPLREARQDEERAGSMSGLRPDVERGEPKPLGRRNSPYVGRKPRVLVVIHNLTGIPPFGGAELYGDTLARALPEFEFVLFASSARRTALTIVDPARSTIDAYPMRFLGDDTAFDPQREHVFHEVLLRHEIDLVHVQHLMHHSWAYPMIGRMLGVPQVATAHDYYLACTRFNLIGSEGRFCGIDTDRTELCDICLKTSQDLPAGAQSRRREIMAEVLAAFDRVLFNTAASRDLFARIYPDLDPATCEVVGMTGEPATLAALAAVPRSQAGPGSGAGTLDEAGRLGIAVIGNLSVPKGGALLVETAWQLRDEAIVFHIHGRIDPEFEEALADLPNVAVAGPYRGAELAGRLSGQVLSLHLSIWPETYCITLDEARAAGLIPVVIGYGALGERVRDGVDGFVVDPERPTNLVRLLRRLRADPGQLDALSPRDRDAHSDVYARHVAAVERIYRAALAEKPVRHGAGPPGHHRVPSYKDLTRRFDNPIWTCPDLARDEPASLAPERQPVRDTPEARRPGWLRGLWTRPARGAQGHLDVFAGPHDASSMRTIARGDLAELRVGGWLLPRDRSAPYASIEVRLEGEGWQATIATILTPRSDVAASLGAPHLAGCGFVSLVELATLPAGRYRIVLRGRRTGGAEDALPAGDIVLV